MPSNFGTVAFTPVIKQLQERYGSRTQYARMEKADRQAGRLGPDEAEYISEQDSFYMATVSSTGWPYVQHRGGPKGFLKVLQQNKIAFADFRGNKQFVSTGNLMTDDRVALILVDYPRQTRLKILGHVQIVEAGTEPELMARLVDTGYRASIDRAFVIHVEAFDWNCPQHIHRRFTEEQIRNAVEPLEERLQELSKENARLRQELAASSGSKTKKGSAS